MTYNKTQVDLERYAFVVLPDMRIDRVNDVWGDADPWSQLVKHVKARLCRTKRRYPVCLPAQYTSPRDVQVQSLFFVVVATFETYSALQCQ